jgi:hypothetical protein
VFLPFSDPRGEGLNQEHAITDLGKDKAIWMESGRIMMATLGSWDGNWKGWCVVVFGGSGGSRDNGINGR